MHIQLAGKTVALVCGDITDQTTDAIVNAANSQLQLGAGVAGAIRVKGGPSIQEECNRIGGTPVGTAVMTGGGQLKAKYIVHTVGPRMGEGNEDKKLAEATRCALEIAATHRLTSIALPAISTGIFGFPLERAANIMIDVVATFLQQSSSLEKVVFCLFSENDYKVFFEALKQRCPDC